MEKSPLTSDILKKEILYVSEEIERLQKRKNLLTELLESMTSSSKNLASSFEVDDKLDKGLINVDKNYPHHGNRQEKILYCLKNIGRAVKAVEIEDFIIKTEGPVNGEKTIRSMYHTLTKNMAAQGQIAFLKFLGSNKHFFFALPEWIDGEKKIKASYIPPNELLGKLPENEKNKIRNAKWTRMKNTSNNS